MTRIYVNGQWAIQYRRQPNESLSEEWAQLQNLLSDVTLLEGREGFLGS